MTKEERIVISAYTSFLMCPVEDVHAYIETKLNRPVLTHEFAEPEFWDRIRNAVKDDFLALCDDRVDR